MMRATICLRKSSRCRGQSLVEFAMASVVTLMLLFGVIEVSRILLVYTTISDAARLGARYAITHGTAANGAPTSTDVSTMQSNVQTVVKSFLGPATVNPTAATITTTFPSLSCGVTSCSGTTPGNLVQVTVSYPYDVLFSYIPISVTVASTSEGVITWGS